MIRIVTNKLLRDKYFRSVFYLKKKLLDGATSRQLATKMNTTWKNQNCKPRFFSIKKKKKKENTKSRHTILIIQSIIIIIIIISTPIVKYKLHAEREREKKNKSGIIVSKF